MQVFIRTTLRGGKETEQLKIIDWTDSSDRKWFTNHSHWAMSNGHKVEFEPANEYHRTIHRIALTGGFGDKIVVRESN